MPDKLIDTNILVYAYDTSEGTKHEVSKSLLKQVWEVGGGIVCLQNLMEFFVVITQKVENPIDVAKAKTIVEDILKSGNWRIIDRDEGTFLSAIDLVSEYKIHLWDALIGACMKENEITEIVTENKEDFEKISDIKVIVPF
ncbi:MAG: PIN domain-containing protein [Patescibacteria group bacterium]|nr:PIN domain-containing protein [Patescibacteria group bacterium]